MRYLIMIALMGMGSSALASTRALELECHFRGLDKESLHCSSEVGFVRGAAEAGVTGADGAEARLLVRCNNGFDLIDRRARVVEENQWIKILGRDKGDRALLELEAVALDSLAVAQPGQFQARLRVENGAAHNLRGECQLKKDFAEETTLE